MKLEKTTYLVYLILIIFSQGVFAQEKYRAEFLKSTPKFMMSGDSYIITGRFISEVEDVKVKFGFNYSFMNANLPFGFFPFVSYKQKMFWNIYEESSPFREINYNPAVGVVKLFVNEKGVTDAFGITIEHESNGKNGIESRSWNYLALNYFKPIGRRWQFRLKMWVPFASIRDNKDIISYRGYASLGATYRLLKRTFIEVDLQPAYKDKLTGAAKFGLGYRISKQYNQFLYLQYFGGYSEDLVNYNKSVNILRVGIMFKDLWANFE